MFLLSTILLTALICGGGAWVSGRYRTLLHPLLMPLASLFVMGVFAPAVQWYLMGERRPEVFQVQTSLLTSLYVAALCLPFLTRINPLEAVFESCLQPLESLETRQHNSRWYAVTLLVLSAVCYLLLICDSPAGWKWILQPRTAYLEGRTGVGHWYVLSQALLFLAFLAGLYDFQIKSYWKLALMTGICAALFLGFGSKNGVVGILIAAGLYLHYFAHPIPQRLLLAAGYIIVPLIIISPWLQGSFSTLRQTMGYYDYFDNSSMYLQHQEAIGLRYGGAFLSSFWEYVPRGFYPYKPFIYGQLYINEYFWPGLSAAGHTPALLPWTIFHLDFGVEGVLVGGLVTGLCYKGIYLHFLHRRTFLSFLTLLQICFVPVVKYSPLLYFAIFLILVSTSRAACQALISGLIPPQQGKLLATATTHPPTRR